MWFYENGDKLLLINLIKRIRIKQYYLLNNHFIAAIVALIRDIRFYNFISIVSVCGQVVGVFDVASFHTYAF